LRASVTTSPLAGVLVADLSRALAGPLAGMMLADLGATVVKVERPGEGDETRAWGPPWTATTSAYFESVNRSKRSVCLDLTDDGDAALARELCARADVVIENYQPGSLERFGLSFDDVSRANPRVVYCSISGFGSHGGGAGLPAYDFVVQAVGGLMSITGSATGEPAKVGVAVVDVLAGKDAVVGILAALRHRDATGVGQRVEADLMSSLLAGLVNQASRYLATGTDPQRLGNRHPSIAPYEMLRCGHGLLAVAVGNDRQFARFAEALGSPGLAADTRFATNSARVANRDELAQLLEQRLTTAPAQVWEQRVRAAGIACGRVNTIGEALAYADDLGLAPLVDLGNGRLPQVRSPIRLSATPSGRPVAPPSLGQHTDEVKRWLSNASTPALPPLT
jgi:crotonobetainyl-CoA:carnitine CoA-transferase CaiB-like acyl-CoA transferase